MHERILFVTLPGKVYSGVRKTSAGNILDSWGNRGQERTCKLDTTPCIQHVDVRPGMLASYKFKDSPPLSTPYLVLA